MNPILNDQMIMTNKHQLIITHNEITNFLYRIAERHPIKINEKSPMMIYMHDYFLGEERDFNKNYKDLFVIAKYHFDFCIVSNILETILKQSKLNILESRLCILFDFIRRMSLKEDLEIKSLEYFQQLLKESCEFYKETYKKMQMGKETYPNTSNLKIPFINPEWMIPRIQELLNNESYFCLIFDKKIGFQWKP